MFPVTSRIPLVRKPSKHFCIICFILLIIYLTIFNTKYQTTVRNFFANDVVDFTYFNNITGFNYEIVPNVVHYVHFDQTDLNFIQVVSIRAVYRNSPPEKILIHCNCFALKGKYWDMVKNISILEVSFMEKPLYIFNKPLSSVFHSSDIARLEILMESGGIFLDSDTYVVKSLNYYRRFEMVLGWPPNQNLGTQLLIAHKNARFLRLWYNSYRYYRRERWYYNAGELPTTFILERMPHLVHRVPYEFGIHNLVHMLYGIKSDEWKNYHAIHLLVRHKIYLIPDDPVSEFNEENIKHYNKTFGSMARLALYGMEDIQ